MPKKILSQTELYNEIKSFRQQQTLILASHSEENEPLASYAPFIEDETGCFFLLLSDLAHHSANLRHHKQQQDCVSVLLIEDEQNARNLFARKRLNYSCQVNIVSREQPQWQQKITMLQQKFGKTIDVLAGLEDFKLYCLTPQKGNYVRGFGQAYELDNTEIELSL